MNDRAKNIPKILSIWEFTWKFWKIYFWQRLKWNISRLSVLRGTDAVLELEAPAAANFSLRAFKKIQKITLAVIKTIFNEVMWTTWKINKRLIKIIEFQNFLVINLKGSVIFLKSILASLRVTFIHIVFSFRFGILKRFSNHNLEHQLPIVQVLDFEIK